jgi:uncharacterized protein
MSPEPSPLPPLSSTPRSTVRRLKDRARSDRQDLYDVLDQGLICHLGLVLDGAPVVLPTAYGRDGDTVYLHGSTGARSLRHAMTEAPICLTVTLLDGVVYGRSVFHHSMNYRSAVVHGRARLLEGDEAMHGLEVLTEHLAPGSWSHARQPDAKELAATAVLAIPLAEASVKVRTGDPKDDAEDIATTPAWAGVVPLQERWGDAVPSGDLAPGVPVPQHVLARASSVR